MEEERFNKKLFIHQTDYHGQGYYGIIGEKETYNSYSFEDDDTGDIVRAVNALINIGFINPEDVLYMEEMEVYEQYRYGKDEKRESEYH